jgi:hypothetical protein
MENRRLKQEKGTSLISHKTLMKELKGERTEGRTEGGAS